MESQKKFLVIRMSSLGDILLTTPVLRRLKERYPGSHVDFLVRREFKDVVASDPFVDRLIVFDKKSGFSGLWKLRDQIRREGYTAILDLHGNVRSFILTFLSGVPKGRINKNKFLRFLLIRFKWNLYRKVYGYPLSVSEKYLRAASFLELPADHPVLHLGLPAESKQRAEEMWSELRKEQFALVVAPGARHFTKRWPAAHYAELIRMVHSAYGYKTVLLGGPDEAGITGEIETSLPEGVVRNLAGRISLLDTFALIERAPCFISNDSGLMHVAAAFGRPQIAFFGSTVEELGFYPLNDHAYRMEVGGLSCRPCTHTGRSHCPKGHFRCMLDIHPDHVRRVVDEWIQNGRIDFSSVR